MSRVSPAEDKIGGDDVNRVVGLDSGRHERNPWSYVRDKHVDISCFAMHLSRFKSLQKLSKVSSACLQSSTRGRWHWNWKSPYNRSYNDLIGGQCCKGLFFQLHCWLFYLCLVRHVVQSYATLSVHVCMISVSMYIYIYIYIVEFKRCTLERVYSCWTLVEWKLTRRWWEWSKWHPSPIAQLRVV